MLTPPATNTAEYESPIAIGTNAARTKSGRARSGRSHQRVVISISAKATTIARPYCFASAA